MKNQCILYLRVQQFWLQSWRCYVTLTGKLNGMFCYCSCWRLLIADVSKQPSLRQFAWSSSLSLSPWLLWRQLHRWMKSFCFIIITTMLMCTSMLECNSWETYIVILKNLHDKICAHLVYIITCAGWKEGGLLIPTILRPWSLSRYVLFLRFQLLTNVPKTAWLMITSSAHKTSRLDGSITAIPTPR